MKKLQKLKLQQLTKKEINLIKGGDQPNLTSQTTRTFEPVLHKWKDDTVTVDDSVNYIYSI